MCWSPRSPDERASLHPAWPCPFWCGAGHLTCMTKVRLLTMPAIALAALAGLSVQAEAVPAASGATESAMAQDYLKDHPGGVITSGNEVEYPDGSGFVASDTGTLSVSECSSGRFCMWSSTSYTGSFTYVSGTAVTRPLTQTVKSFWNNRSQAARLYDNAGTSSTCHGAGTMKSSLAVSYQSPAKVHLSAGSTC